jgi:hypothetical protein
MIVLLAALSLVGPGLHYLGHNMSIAVGGDYCLPALMPHPVIMLLYLSWPTIAAGSADPHLKEASCPARSNVFARRS